MDILPFLDELHMMAREGLRFADNPYDQARYTRLLELVCHSYGAALDLPPPTVRARLAAELGRITPKVGANAAIFNEAGLILLMQRTDDQRWGLPGGLVEVNELPADTAIREAREETGLICRSLGFVDFFTRPASANAGLHSLVAAVYLCEVIGGTLQVLPEAVAVQYWAIGAVPTWHADHERQAQVAYRHWYGPEG